MNTLEAMVLSVIFRYPGFTIREVISEVKKMTYNQSPNEGMILVALDNTRGAKFIREENHKLFLTESGKKETVDRLQQLQWLLATAGYPECYSYHG